MLVRRIIVALDRLDPVLDALSRDLALVVPGFSEQTFLTTVLFLELLDLAGDGVTGRFQLLDLCLLLLKVALDDELRWDEIKDVYTYNLGYRLIGITLNDPKTVYRRLGLKRSWMLRANGLVAPLYKPFRVRVAPINIPQEYLPMSADELLVQIQTYRDAYS